MRQTGKSALAKYAARGKCYLVMIHPVPDGLIMIQLRHQEEMRSIQDVDIPPSDLKQDELDLAVQLINQVSSDEFNPEKYTDEVRHHMLRVIDQKVNGDQIIVVPEEQPEAKIIDIMEALKASLKAQGKAGSTKAKAKKAPKNKPRRRPHQRKLPRNSRLWAGVC